MNSKAHVIFESWNLKGPSIPERSPLYNLEPIGAGTGSVESLTSYASRLATAHCMSPAVLLTRTLVPIIGKKYWLRGKATSSTRGSLLGYSVSTPAKVINGRGTIAEDWVNALQGLTLRNDLRFLTMLAWAEVFAQRNLLRSSRAWCPTCYEDRRANNQIVYEPLLWTFLDVQVCVKHQRRLSSQCQHCRRELPWLARCGQPGYCSKCGEWLGADLCEPSMDTEISLRELEWQTWVAKNLEEMISAATYLPEPPKERMAQALSLCINQTSNGIMNQFACLIGKRKNTVWGWQHGKTRIPIGELLHICYRVGISLVDFLYANCFVLNDIELMSEPLVSGVNANRRPARQFNREVIERGLRAILNAQTSLPMIAVAEKLELNKRLLYRHFPELCKAIAARHKRHKQLYFKNRRHESQKEISETSTRLLASGIYPSRRSVARIIRSPKLHETLGDKARTIRDLQIAA